MYYSNFLNYNFPPIGFGYGVGYSEFLLNSPIFLNQPFFNRPFFDSPFFNQPFINPPFGFYSL